MEGDAFFNSANVVVTVDPDSYALEWCIENNVQYALRTSAEADFTVSTLSDGTLEITGYSGTDANVVVPASIGGVPVTQIGYGALVHALCGVKLRKVDSFTDWPSRPMKYRYMSTLK